MKKMLLNNTGWKLLSLCLAFIAWIVIVNVDDPVITKMIHDVPVTILNEDAIGAKDKVYEIAEGEKVSVSVKGKRSTVDALKVSDILATADLSALSEWNAVPIIVSFVSSKDRDVEISLSGSVQMLKIVLEDKLTRQFQVSVKTIGEIREGFYLYNAEVKPNLIEVSGGVSAMNRIADVRVELNVANEDRDFTKKLKLKIFDNNGDEVDIEKYELSAEEVKVKTTIWETKVVPVVVKATGDPAYGYQMLSLDYEPQSIRLAGTTEALEQVNSIPLTVDITNSIADKEFEIILEDVWAELIPDDVRIADVKIADGTTNVSVKATIGKMNTRSFTISKDDVEVRNAHPKFTYEFDEASLIPRITLMGSDEMLDSFHPEEYVFYIDMSGYAAGKHIMNLRVEDLPAGLVITENVPVTIVVGRRETQTPNPDDEENPDDSEDGSEESPEPSASPSPFAD